MHFFARRHSQGASHAAYLSTVRRLRAAVLLSGPQELPGTTAGWIHAAAARDGVLRRAAYALREACGDEPADPTQFCTRAPRALRANLQKLGVPPVDALVRNRSGFVVTDLAPLLEEHRFAHHDSTAVDEQAPPEMRAVWSALFEGLAGG